MAELEPRFVGPGFEGPRNFKASLFLLGELGLRKIDIVTDPWTLQERLRFFDADKVILRNPKAVI